MRREGIRNRRGFSLVELLVVVAIMLAIAAYAMPNMLSAISDYRLKNTMSQVVGLYQQQRIEAVRGNTVRTSPTATTVSGGTALYIDRNENGSYDAGEPLVVFPNKIGIATSGAPTMNTSLLGYNPQPLTTPIRFNARGLPCLGTSPCANPDTSSGSAKPVGFVIYFKNDKSFGQTGWGAITITPAGRIKSWFYSGSTYGAN